MKAQVSIEFLIVFTIFLAILVVSMISLSYVKEKGEKSLEEQRIRLTVQEISNTVNNICILGKGNSRNIHLQLENYSLEMPNFETMRLIYKNNSATEKVLCEFTEGTYSNNIKISCCEENKILIE
jgi:uncharacterized protein (UPF0333 family)